MAETRWRRFVRSRRGLRWYQDGLFLVIVWLVLAVVIFVRVVSR